MRAPSTPTDISMHTFPPTQEQISQYLQTPVRVPPTWEIPVKISSRVNTQEYIEGSFGFWILLLQFDERSTLQDCRKRLLLPQDYFRPQKRLLVDPVYRAVNQTI